MRLLENGSEPRSQRSIFDSRALGERGIFHPNGVTNESWIGLGRTSRHPETHFRQALVARSTSRTKMSHICLQPTKWRPGQDGLAVRNLRRLEANVAHRRSVATAY